jgi:hypothetical protein
MADKSKSEQDVEQDEPVEALGPVVPEGATAADPPEKSGKATKGVQPVDPEDIPESGR